MGWKQAARFSRSDVSLQTPPGKVLTEVLLGQDPGAAAEPGTGWGLLQVLVVWLGLEDFKVVKRAAGSCRWQLCPPAHGCLQFQSCFFKDGFHKGGKQSPERE